MNITEKLAAIKTAHKINKRRRPWWKRSVGALKLAYHLRDPKGSDRHHRCAALGTATKNTHRNKWNIRPKKRDRREARFVQLRTFKDRYNLS